MVDRQNASKPAVATKYEQNVTSTTANEAISVPTLRSVGCHPSRVSSFSSRIHAAIATTAAIPRCCVKKLVRAQTPPARAIVSADDLADSTVHTANRIKIGLIILCVPSSP